MNETSNPMVRAANFAGGPGYSLPSSGSRTVDFLAGNMAAIGGSAIALSAIVSILPAAAGFYLAKKRKADSLGTFGWTAGSFFFPRVVPAFGIIATLR